MDFNNIQAYKYLILVFVSLIICIVGLRKKEKILKILDLSRFSKKEYIKLSFITISLILIVLALMEPQVLKDEREIKKEGLDIYVLIDVSKSMLAEDIKPNRLKRTKESIENLIENLKGDRIGFIPFSSGSYVQMPLTDDYDLAKMFLSVIDTDMISGGGTNISSAIKLANKSFKESSLGDKVLIIFSDGEEHNESAINDVLKEKDLKVYTIGVGSLEGSFIPEKDSYGRKIGWKKDRSGAVINSRLNPKILMDIAKAGNGQFFMAKLDGSEIKKLENNIKKLKRGALKNEKMKVYNNLYQYFLALGLLCFLIGYFSFGGIKK